MRRALCRGWSGRCLAVGALAFLITSPVVSYAAPIVFRVFNLGGSKAYVVQRNASTMSTQSTTSQGVLTATINATTGDQIVLAPDVDLSPPLPPSFNSVTAQSPSCAHLAWTPSGDPAVVGYRISYGTLSVEGDQIAQYQYSLDVGPVSSYDVCSLASATYYFAVQAINYAGQISSYSSELSVQTTPAAIVISRFDANVQGGGVRLSWQVVPDASITGYLVYRRTDGGDEEPLMTTPLAPSARTYVDGDVRTGTNYTYVLAVLRKDGSEVRSAPASATTPSIAFALDPNEPNPFRGETRIPFTLDTASHVTVRVYDVTGRLVTTLFDGTLSEGPHKVTWNTMDGSGRHVASGAYFYTLTSGLRMQSKKMVLVR